VAVVLLLQPHLQGVALEVQVLHIAAALVLRVRLVQQQLRVMGLAAAAVRAVLMATVALAV
jgi:hypothetical protein